MLSILKAITEAKRTGNLIPTDLEIEGRAVCVGYTNWYDGWYATTPNLTPRKERAVDEGPNIHLDITRRLWDKRWDQRAFQDPQAFADLLVEASGNNSPELAAYDELDQQE